MKMNKTLVALSLVFAISACSESQNAQSHLTKAKEYISANQINESIIELKNTLRIDNKNSEARFLLGKQYLFQGKGNLATKELEHALANQYSKTKVVPLLAQAYMLIDSANEVYLLDKYSESLPNEAKSHYLAYKTKAALFDNKIADAENFVKQTQSLSPGNLYSLLAESYLALAQKNLLKAETLTGQILAINAKHSDTLMLQGQVALAANNFKQAVSSFEQHLQLQPYSGITQLLLAEAYLLSGNNVKAELLADEVLAKVNRQPFATYIKAMVRFAEQDYQQSSELAEVALQSKVNKPSLKLVAGASAFQLKKYELSYQHLNEITPYLPKNHVARRMLVICQLKLGMIDDISKTLSDYQSSTPDDDNFISSISFELMSLGAIHEAKEVFAQSSSSNPKNAEESARIGMLKLMMNDPSGMDSLKESIVMNPDFIEAELALAYAAIKTGDIEQATEIAIKWQGKYPTKPDGYNLMAVIFLQSSQNDKAKKELDKSLKLDEKNLFALSKLIIISAQENNEKEVQRLSTKLLKLYPNNVKVLTQYFQLNPNVVGLAEVEKAYKANPKELNTGVLYAGALMHLKEYQKTIDLLEQYQPDSRTPKVYWKLLYGANRQLEKMEQSNRILKQWRKTSPYHIEPVMMLADGFAKKGKYDRALTIINQALALNKSAKVLKLVKMQLLLDSKQLAEGQRLFDTLDKGKLTDIVKLNFQGRLLLLEKKYQQASNKLEVLYKKSPSDQNLLYLVSAYKNNKEDNKAIIILERHLVKNTENDQLKNLLASFYLKKQKSKALSLYAQLYQRHPTNFVLNNNLAWLYMEKGELTLALSHAEKAYELAPENPNVVDTYGQVLLKNGNKRLALEKSEQAYSLSETKNIDIALNYIEALVVNSRKNKAKKLLDQLSVDSIEQNKKKAQLINQL